MTNVKIYHGMMTADAEVTDQELKDILHTLSEKPDSKGFLKLDLDSSVVHIPWRSVNGIEVFAAAIEGPKCPRCFTGRLYTDQVDMSTPTEPNQTIDGHTRCQSCGYIATFDREGTGRGPIT